MSLYYLSNVVNSRIKPIMHKFYPILFILIFLISCNKREKSISSISTILLKKGIQFQDNGEYEEAKSVYFMIINSKVDIDSTARKGIYTLIGETFEKQDSFNLAEKYYFKAKEMNKLDWEIWVILGSYYGKLLC